MSGQPRGVDQSNRIVPINLRQSGLTPTELLISTRVRKSPYWHLSHAAGCWRATVYNRCTIRAARPPRPDAARSKSICGSRDPDADERWSRARVLEAGEPTNRMVPIAPGHQRRGSGYPPTTASSKRRSGAVRSSSPSPSRARRATKSIWGRGCTPKGCGARCLRRGNPTN